MNRSLRMILFLVLALIQLAVPAVMMGQWETTLREGRPYKFRTAPVDPYDAFRGRYVALRVETNTLPYEGQAISSGRKVFVLLSEGADGFARLDSMSLTRPTHSAYLSARILSCYGGQAHLQFPFDRYYMKEDLAPKAEKAYFRASSRTNRTAHIQVRVRDGRAVVEELFIEDVPIGEYLKRPES